MASLTMSDKQRNITNHIISSWTFKLCLFNWHLFLADILRGCLNFPRHIMYTKRDAERIGWGAPFARPVQPVPVIEQAAKSHTVPFVPRTKEVHPDQEGLARQIHTLKEWFIKQDRIGLEDKVKI